MNMSTTPHTGGGQLDVPMTSKKDEGSFFSKLHIKIGIFSSSCLAISLVKVRVLRSMKKSHMHENINVQGIS